MTTRRCAVRAGLAAVLSVLVVLPAAAHGLLLKLDTQGVRVDGIAYFTNGEVAADEWVEWVDLDAPANEPVGSRTDGAGRFGFEGAQGHRYRVRAYAEEGHNVELELTLEAAAAPPQLVDTDGQVVDPWWPPPAWLVIGGLLLASMPFARFFRSPRRSPGEFTA